MPEWRPWAISEFLAKLPLIPRVVAWQVGLKMNLSEAQIDDFARYAESRTIAVLNHNRSFRRKMFGPHSRYWLHLHMEHWCEGWLKAQPKKRARRNVNELF